MKIKFASRKDALRKSESSLRNKFAGGVVLFGFDESYYEYLEKNYFMVLELVKTTLVEIMMNQRFSVMLI